jgi:hypothetical protein
MYGIDLHSLLKADEGNGYVMLAGDYCTIQTQFEQGDKLFVSLVFRVFCHHEKCHWY